MRIAFLTTTDPLDRRSWSGTPYCMSRALRTYCGDVTCIGPLKPAARAALRVYAGIRNQVLPDRYLWGHSRRFAKACGRLASVRLSRREFDVVVAVAADSAVAFLETHVPVVYISDATFALMVDYYPGFSRLCPSSRSDGNEIESLAIRRADALVYPSQWAARSAVDDYGADARRVHVLAFGANLEGVPEPGATVTRETGERCTLLFVGKSWERKGGEIAFDALVALRELGTDAELVVCGCVPPPRFSHAKLTVVPFLDKSSEADRLKLARLYGTAHFFLLPTRSECSGIVYAEASAYGVPVITTETGGVLGMVTNGRNGYALPPHARGEDYAQLIQGIRDDPERYTMLRRTSRQEFDERLNWDAWGLSMRDILSETVLGARMRSVPDAGPGRQS